MWLSPTAIPGTAQPASWLTSLCRLTESAIAVRRSGESRPSTELAISSCSWVADVSTSLCAPGSPVIEVRKDGVTVVGSATCTKPELIHWASSAVEEATYTVIERALAAVPHHLGFCTNFTVEPVTEPIMKGPPERSMARSTVEHVGSQPTFSMTWAGNRSLNSLCQSA